LALPAHDATTLFEVPFASAMSDLDLALLERTLNLSLRPDAKKDPRPASLGFARLDRDSGLFLEPGKRPRMARGGRRRRAHA